MKFQFNHYLYEGFKRELKVSFGTTMLGSVNWSDLVERGEGTAQRLEQLEQEIDGLRESLRQVGRMQSTLK